jgi:two-component system, OmpR family, sensor histidine kinase BaeS
MSRPQPEPTAGPSLRLRVFAAMGLVVLAGAGTLAITALLVAPAVFHQHLEQAGVAQSPDVAMHVDEGFATALLVSIAVGVLAAVIVAAAVALIVARRINDPVAAAAATASRLAAGDYSARVTRPLMGPELADLADSVNALADRLEQTEASRLRLVTDLAHELRTPLTAIDATVEAIADGILPADATTLSTLTDQSRRLSRLVDDLGAVSRADERSFRLDPRPVDLVEVASAATTATAARFVAKGVGLETRLGPPVTVIADADRIAEVIGQLLDNSLRRCRAADHVTVTVDRRGDSAVIAVTDTGSGFDPAEADRLFQRFYRAGSDPSGSGIGLTIARTLIEAHGGALRATSPGPGRGATFAITLPTGQWNAHHSGDARL